LFFTLCPRIKYASLPTLLHNICHFSRWLPHASQYPNTVHSEQEVECCNCRIC
jgi:hypothetical protein